MKCAPFLSRGAALFLVIVCPIRAFAGGVTVITHGFNANVTDWIIPMAGKIGAYPGFPGGSYSCYEISITRNAMGQYVAAASLIGGVAPLLTDSGEIVVKLDWSSVSSLGGASTTAVAEAAVSAVLSTSLIPDLGGHSLGEGPLHLIGHSRGGSVVAEMARLLGAQGAWVDHVSTLDPRPVASFGDAAVTTWANVLYADNVWQNMGDGLFVPNGQSVFGAYNRRLLDLNGGYSSTHSDVHLWYHGTVELTTPATDTQATITATQRTTWWTTAEAQGAGAGFLYSLIGGGNRLSNLEPAGAGNGRIKDGFNGKWDLGAGLTNNRTTLPANNGAWPNPLRFLLGPANMTPAGETFDYSFYYQAGANGVGEIALDVLLDPDANPYNGNEFIVEERSVSRTGPNAISLASFTATVNPALVPPGTYAVFARVADGNLSRYLYARDRLVVPVSGQPPFIDGASLVRDINGVFRFDVHGFPGQHIVVSATTDFVNWTPLATHTFTGTTWSFSDGTAGSLPARFYRAQLAQ